MNDGFANRVAVVTGGASGIGLAVAKQIAAEGGQVALRDLDAGKLETARTTVEPPTALRKPVSSV
ncbi:SDR family NAD(P)-dependent oxidoreductase [Amycolatopsis sp. NPDC049252]|uniref:SDR family NAD(P)-dependent oxidoreductase n=1 Tax=Amycolatopsis sp. NPDC049252 TaxID=3363933 RepID=UPI003722D245